MRQEMEHVETSARARWPWWVLAFDAVLGAAGLFYEIRAIHTPLPPDWFGPRGFAIPLGIAFGVTGALLTTRVPRNPIGPLLCIGSVFGAVQAIAGPYVVWTVGANHSTSLLSRIAAESIEWVWIPPLAMLGVVFAVFPNGRVLPGRWRTWLIVGLVGTGLLAIGSAVISPLSYYGELVNPIGVPSLTQVGYAFAPGLLILLVLGLASLVVRFRRATGDEREQLKWLAFVAGMLATAFGAYAFTLGGVYVFVSRDSYKRIIALPVFDILATLMVIAILAMPVAIAIGILKYRLYEIDLVIRKTVVFGVVVILMTAAFLVIAAAVGALVAGSATGVLVAVAFVVGALIGPFRRIAERIADRWVFGGRATPYEVLAEFSRRAADAYTADDVLPRMAQIAAAGVGATRARVWVRVGHELAVGATTAEPAPAVALHGDELPALPEDHAAPVFHRGELLGAIGVRMPPSDPMTPEKERLVADLAAQAGAVIANAGLIEELRASRQRLVAAQDEERRRLERNIHDGAQQQLVALAVKLRLLKQTAERDPAAVPAFAEQLQEDAGEALETLRDLARGVYPPLLADKGLAAALEAQARKAALPVEVESDGIGRYGPDVEATVYFCTLEALNNAAKYAEASRVEVELFRAEGALAFRVVDDGRGFDSTSTSYGTGLQGMADRLDAIGGTLQVESTPGAGTRVTGSIPVGD